MQVYGEQRLRAGRLAGSVSDMRRYELLDCDELHTALRGRDHCSLGISKAEQLQVSGVAAQWQQRGELSVTMMVKSKVPSRDGGGIFAPGIWLFSKISEPELFLGLWPYEADSSFFNWWVVTATY